jgi:phosphoribosylformylglycinamidine synthase
LIDGSRFHDNLAANPLAPAPTPAYRVRETPQRKRPDMKARIFVTLKGGVLDPQGRAIHHALEGLGFSGVNDVRAGKLIELDLADGTSDADIDAMCKKLLANTVIENYRIEKGN